MPKLRGAARDRLRDVLRHWGSVDDAVRSTRSRSRSGGAAGYYRLGVLAEPALRDVVLAGLDDRDFAVRRTAMIALGSFPESVVIDHLLTAARRSPGSAATSWPPWTGSVGRGADAEAGPDPLARRRRGR